MQILLYEHFCSGGLAGQPLDCELVAEGGGMLRGLADDFHAAGHDLTIMLDQRLRIRLPGRVVAIDSASPVRARDAFVGALTTADAALVVAPEQDEILPTMLEHVERVGVINLGSASAAVRFVSDKHAITRHLAAAGIPVPWSELGLEHAPGMLERFGEIVVKPNRGAGCIDTHVFGTEADLAALPHRTDWVVQQRIPGLAASVAFIVPRTGGPIPLRAGTQEVGVAGGSRSGRLAYSGGRLPLGPALESRAISLGEAALRQVAGLGLHGCVGIDLVLGERPGQDALIEINARPTVAYAGLRRLARFSIPDLIVGRPSPIEWGNGGVSYRADGTCAILP